MVLSKKELGQLVKKARKLKSEKNNKLYTQKMLACDINKSQSYIGDIESGRTYPSFVLLNEIAAACEVSISFFVPEENLDNHIDKFIKLQLADTLDTEVDEIRKYIKNDPDVKLNHIYDYVKDNGDILKETSSCNTFKTPEEALSFFLNQQIIQNFLQIDFNKMSQEEQISFRNDVLSQFKLISYKYKK